MRNTTTCISLWSWSLAANWASGSLRRVLSLKTWLATSSCKLWKGPQAAGFGIRSLDGFWLYCKAARVSDADALYTDVDQSDTEHFWVELFLPWCSGILRQDENSPHRAVLLTVTCKPLSSWNPSRSLEFRPGRQQFLRLNKRVFICLFQLRHSAVGQATSNARAGTPSPPPRQDILVNLSATKLSSY